MEQSREQLLGNHPVKSLLMKLSIPATIGMFVNALYNLADTLFVGRGVNEIAIGALGLAFPVQMIVWAVGLMIGVGSASVFSRAFGRRDYESMRNVVNTALRIDFVLALVLAVLGRIFLEDLLYWFGASISNIGYAKDYLSIILIGLLPLSMSMILNNLNRAEGRPLVAMKAMILGAGLNILLDPFFIFDFGLGLGVRGAAMATVTSQFISFAYIFTKSISKESKLQINLKGWFDIHVKTIKEIIQIGLPTFLRNSIGAFLAIIIFRLINFYAEGDPAIYISIYSVINRVIFFIFMPGFGLVQGLAPIVGFNWGAKNYKRLREVIVFAATIIGTYFTLGFLFVQLFSKQIFSIFSETNDVFFITYGADSFRIISIGFILVGFQIITASIYQALGYPIRALLISISRQFLLFVPIALLMTHFFELQGIWYTFAISDILAGIISFIMLQYELKVFKKLINR